MSAHAAGRVNSKCPHHAVTVGPVQTDRARQAVTDPQARQQALTELRAHPQVRHYQRAVTDPQLRQLVLVELRGKANFVAAGLKKRLG